MVFGHGGFDDQARRDEELRLEREERERIEREDRERQELMEERRRQAEEYPAHQKHAQRATDGTFQERFEALESPERLTLQRDRDWVEDDEAGRRTSGDAADSPADVKDLARVRPGAEGKDAAGAADGDSAATWDEELEAMHQQEQELAERRAALNPRSKTSGLDDEDDEEEEDEDGAGGGGDDDFAATGGGSSPAAAIAALLLVLIGAAAFYFGWYLPGQRERQSEPQQPKLTSLSSAELPLAERGADLSNPLNVEPELPQPEADDATEDDATEDDASAAADAAEAQTQPAEPAAQPRLPEGVTAEDFSTSPQRSAAAADDDTDNATDAGDEADASADEATPPWNAADFLGAVPNTAAMPGAPAEDDAEDREDGDAESNDAENEAAQDEQDAADTKQNTAEPTAAPAETAETAAAAATAAAEQETPEAVADDAQTRDTEQGQLEQLTTRVAALESTLGELTQHLQSRAAAPAGPARPAATRAAPAKKPTPPAPPKRLTDDSGVHPVLLSVDAWAGEPSVMVGTTAPGDKRVRVMRAGDTYNGIHLESIGSDGTSAVFTASDGVRVTLNLNQQDSQQ